VVSNDKPADVGDESAVSDLNDLVELEIVREVDADGNPVESTVDDDESNGDRETMGEESRSAGDDEADVVELEYQEDAAGEAAGSDTVEELTGERDRLREDLLRAQADFINFRKRMEREKREVILRASQSLIEELLPVVDNFELALANNQGQADADTFGEGVRLIHKQLVDLLSRHGLQEVSCVGETFDPNIHEAVAVVRDPEQESNTVVAELKKGYYLRERLIRSPMVQVVINEEDEPADQEAQDTSEPPEPTDG
jgi:molecular chaperone GrpE